MSDTSIQDYYPDDKQPAAPALVAGEALDTSTEVVAETAETTPPEETTSTD